MHNSLSNILIFSIITLIIYPCALADTNRDITLKKDVKWEPLNPARGDKSPMSATLWGDRHGPSPTGFLVRFVDGFSSPPHIHNVTYRGLVIDGHIHNDDPEAKKMWMKSGSFWAQPAGEIHITSAKGDYNLAYIEIDEGPYLVRPIENSFDNGQRPINIDISNIVWIKQNKTTNTSGIELAHLWGRPHTSQKYGILAKLPPTKSIKISSYGSVFHAVIIKGLLDYLSNENNHLKMTPGSYFTIRETQFKKISTNEESIIYVHTNGKLEFSLE